MRIQLLLRADKLLLSKTTVNDMVDVAQLVEHPVVVRNVAGSSPVIHPSSSFSNFIS
jgi:hypothetical protein